MSDFTPAKVADDAPVADEQPIPVVSRLSPAELAMLGIAEQVAAGFRAIAAGVPSQAGLSRNAAAIEAGIASIRAIDK